MTILPIVERELRVAAKRRSTYYGRSVIAGIVVVLGVYMHLISGFLRAGGGIIIFGTATVCLSMVAVVSGFASCDSISKEKRDGTIGFLFLTDLKGIDIVLGKLAASAVPAIYAAAGVLPVLAIALLLGGVSARQFWEASLALLNLFFLSHAVAMLGSALFRNAQNAIGFPFLILTVYLIALGCALIAEDSGWLTTCMLLQIFNPIYTLYFAVSVSSAPSAFLYGASLAAVHLTGWFFVVLASAILPHCWQEKPKKPARLRVWWEQRRFGNSAERTALRRQLAGVNPFLWLVSRRQFGPGTIWAALWIFAVALASLAVWEIRTQNDRWSDIYGGLFIFATVVVHCSLKVAIVSATVNPLQLERANGGLEMILSCTPLLTKEIIAGHWLALRRWFLAPVMAVIALGLVMVITASISVERGSDKVELMWFIFAASVVLAPDMMALGWISMHVTMSQPKRQSPIGIISIIAVCVTPWIIIGAIYITSAALLGMREPPAPWLLWIILAFAIDIGLCKNARRSLEMNFRRWAVSS